jgi:hypothetical protein
MNVLLKIIALLVALAVFLTLLLVIQFNRGGGIAILARSGIGIFTLISWLIILTCGPIAAVQLWRLRKVGLYLSAMLSALALCYYVVGLVMFRVHGAPLKPLLAAVIANGTVVAILLSPRALRTCARN